MCDVSPTLLALDSNQLFFSDECPNFFGVFKISRVYTWKWMVGRFVLPGRCYVSFRECKWWIHPPNVDWFFDMGGVWLRNHPVTRSTTFKCVESFTAVFLRETVQVLKEQSFRMTSDYYQYWINWLAAGNSCPSLVVFRQATETLKLTKNEDQPQVATYHRGVEVWTFDPWHWKIHSRIDYRLPMHDDSMMSTWLGKSW